MRYALQVLSNSGTSQGFKLVSIDEVNPDEVRKLVFRCPDADRCSALVSPVFPAVEQQKYFAKRKGKDGHSEGCRRDSVIAACLSAGDSRTDNVVPTRFVERLTTTSANGAATTSDAKRRPEGGGDQPNEREATTSHILWLVRAYESMTDSQRASTRLVNVPACPGKTYASVFRSLSEYSVTGPESGCYIYVGEYESYDWHYTGLSIFLRHATPSGLPLTVWVRHSLGSDEFGAEYVRQILAGPCKRYRVYALGRFVSFKGKKLTIEISSFAQLCISEI